MQNELMDDIDKYNYLVDKIVKIDDKIDDLDERIKNAVNNDAVRELETEKNELMIEKEEYEDQLEEVKTNL